MTTGTEELLDGPRGRRLCLELVMELDQDIRSAVFWLGNDLDPGRGTSRALLTSASGDTGAPQSVPSPEQLAAILASLDPAGLDGNLVQAALAQSVSSARYWQEPDGEDVLAELPVIRTVLAPLAEQVLASPATQWWAQPRRSEQWAMDWRSGTDPAPLPRDPGGTLRKWAAAARAEEEQAARERPDDPRANWSGSWWSAPLGLIRTVGQIAAGLNLVEDSLGWTDATAIPVRGAGRTLELRTADDWLSLCRTYPLDVTASRRHDWFRTTGRDGHWVIPDWERVAGDWDAVHLTVLGYLGSAGRALEVDADTATVLAGWDPDSTLWLADVAREADGQRQIWHRSPDDDSWTRVA